MKRTIVALFTAVLVASSMIGGAAAAQDEPGIPGEKNCKGQTVAYLAQAGQDFGVPGLGNLADFAGLSVQEVHEIVEAYCAS